MTDRIDEHTAEQLEYFKRIGSLEFWDSKPFIDAANILVAADEPKRALAILDGLPGYYRDNQPPEIKELKRQIYALLATPTFYAQNPHDQLVREENAISTLECTLRGSLIEKDFQDLCGKGLTPHLIDLGPGEYWLPIALHKRAFSFTYQDIGLCTPAQDKAYAILAEHLKPRQPDQPVVFVACELIEHLHHEEDIRTDYERAGGQADIVHISTPKYTFDGRLARLNWRQCGDLGHLRTYTPREFERSVCQMFPEFEFMFYDSQIMHMRGERRK